MKSRAGVCGLVFVLSAWITLTLLMVDGAAKTANHTSQAVASALNYRAPKPVALRLKGTNRDLTFPSWNYLNTGRIWSYVSGKRGIDPKFVPPLADISGDHPSWLIDKRIQPLAKPDLEAFVRAAAAAKHPVLISSAYRSGADQEAIRKDTAATSGAAYVEEYVAKPGHSEHQLGLAVDFTSFSEKCKAAFANCALDNATANWLAAHAHEYGFILRYQKGKEKITGVASESWHFRYVGKELAALLRESDLTFDEVYWELVSRRVK